MYSKIIERIIASLHPENDFDPQLSRKIGFAIFFNPISVDVRNLGESEHNS